MNMIASDEIDNSISFLNMLLASLDRQDLRPSFAACQISGRQFPLRSACFALCDPNPREGSNATRPRVTTNAAGAVDASNLHLALAWAFHSTARSDLIS
jgi:hypothetical protein